MHTHTNKPWIIHAQYGTIIIHTHVPLHCRPHFLFPASLAATPQTGPWAWKHPRGARWVHTGPPWKKQRRKRSVWIKVCTQEGCYIWKKKQFTQIRRFVWIHIKVCTQGGCYTGEKKQFTQIRRFVWIHIKVCTQEGCYTEKKAIHTN